MWLDLPLDDEWVSWVRFEPQDGHPVIAELHVRPRALALRGQTAGTATPVGGLTSRALRGVHLGRALELAYAHLNARFEREQRYPGSTFPSAFTEAAASEPRRPGRKGRDDRFYVRVAIAYIDAIEQGSRKPVVTAAQALSEASGGTYEVAYVRDLLHVARQRGLLTRPPKGRAVGQLTQKALQLLER